MISVPAQAAFTPFGLSRCDWRISRACASAGLRWGALRSAHVARRSEPDLVAALELQHLARLVRARDGEAEPFDDLAHRAHLLRVALGELAGAEPERVLEADADVAAH